MPKTIRVGMGVLIPFCMLLASPVFAAAIDHFFARSPILNYDSNTALETLQRTYPDLAFDEQSVTYVTRRAKTPQVERIAFSLYKNRLTSSRITLKEGVSSAQAIAAAAKRRGYSIINERDIGVVASHSNGSSMEASTSRRKKQWHIVIGPRDPAADTGSVAVPVSPEAAPGAPLTADAGEPELKAHLQHFLANAPLMHFTQSTSLRQIEQYYPGLALLSGKVSDYGTDDNSTDFVERVEFHTENDGKRLTWIGVYFKPGLDQAAMAKTFSSVLAERYGPLIRDTSSEHLVRRKDFTNAFHTRWYFRQKQWSAGIYPPK